MKLFFASITLILALGGRAQAGAEPGVTSFENPGTVTIAAPEAFSKVYVLSDAHGMYEPLLNLLRASALVDENLHWKAGKSLLVVIGDSIDKGSGSIEIVDLWIRLMAEASAQKGQVLHLLGNHEADFLADPTNRKAAALRQELASRGIPLAEFADPAQAHGSFLHSLPVAARVGSWIFFHAGKWPGGSWESVTQKAKALISANQYGDPFFSDANSMLEARAWEQDPLATQGVLSSLDALGAYGLMFGHQPDAFGIEGRSAAKFEGRLVKIDNGMAPDAGSYPGSMLEIINPSQMTKNSFPEIQVIEADGSSRPMAVE